MGFFDEPSTNSNKVGGGFFNSSPSSEKDKRLDELLNRIQNTETRLKASGVNPNEDTRNWFEKWSNLPKDQNFFFDTLDILQRPLNATMNTTEEYLEKGYASSDDFMDGLSGRRKTTGSDVLDELGVENKYAKGIGGFALDVVADPINLIPGAAFAKAGRGIAQGAKGVDNLAQNIPGYSNLREGARNVFVTPQGPARDIRDNLVNQGDYLLNSLRERSLDSAKKTGLGAGTKATRELERLLEINKDAPEVIDRWLKGDMKTNIFAGQYADLFTAVNKLITESDEVVGRTTRLDDSMTNLQNRIDELVQNKFGSNDAFENATIQLEDLLPPSVTLDSLGTNAGRKFALQTAETDEIRELIKDVGKVKGWEQGIQRIADKSNTLKGGLQVNPIQGKGTGFEVNNPMPNIFRNALGDVNKAIDEISPKKSIDEMFGPLANDVKESVARLVRKGSVKVQDKAVRDAIKKTFGKEVKIDFQNVKLANPEKYMKSAEGFKKSSENAKLQKQLLDQETTKYVDDSIKPFEQNMTLWNQQEMEWDAVKQLKEEYKRLRGEKFSVPQGNKADWLARLPKGFYSAKSSNDIYAAAQAAGFNSVDEFVDHLVNLDRAWKTKRKDIVDDNLKVDLDKVRKDLAKEFRKTQSGKNLLQGLKAFSDEMEDAISPNFDGIQVTDTIEKVNIPRPDRPSHFGADVPDNLKTERAMREIENQNKIVRNFAEENGVSFNKILAYVRHELSSGEKAARNKVTRSGKAGMGGNDAVNSSRKYDGSVEDVNELTGEELFEINAYMATAEGQRKVIDYVVAEGFLNQVIKGFSRKVTSDKEDLAPNETIIQPSKLKFFKDGNRLGVRKGDEYIVDKDTARLLNSFDKALSDEGMNGFIKMTDKLTSIWKRFALLSLGYHVRNGVGNSWNMYIAGMNPASQVAYTGKALSDLNLARQAENKLRKLSPKDRDNRSFIESTLTKDELKAYDSYNEFLSKGLKGSSFHVEDFDEATGESSFLKELQRTDPKNRTVLGEVGRKANVFEGSRKLGVGLDTVQRYTLYKWAKDKKKPNPDKLVKQSLFDYTDLTETERNLFRRVMPFYTFTRKNIPFQLKNFFLQPQKYTALDKAANTSYELANMEEQDLPEWYRDSMAFAISGDGTGDGKLANLMVPGADIDRIHPDRVMKEISGMLNPGLKIPIELGANYNTFLGKPIQEFEGQKVDGLPARADYLLDQLGAVRNARRVVESGQEGDTTNALFGGLIKDQDKQLSEYFQQRGRLDELEGLMKLFEQQTGSRPPTLKELEELGLTK